jgi:hypothetical protein
MEVKHGANSGGRVLSSPAIERGRANEKISITELGIIITRSNSICNDGTISEVLREYLEPVVQIKVGGRSAPLSFEELVSLHRYLGS